MANACTVSAVGVLRVPRVRRGDTFEIGSCLKCPSVVLLWDLKIGPISKAESATGHDLSKSPALPPSFGGKGLLFTRRGHRKKALQTSFFQLTEGARTVALEVFQKGTTV